MTLSKEYFIFVDYLYSIFISIFSDSVPFSDFVPFAFLLLFCCCCYALDYSTSTLSSIIDLYVVLH